MGQAEVLKTLKKEMRWMSSKEVSKISQTNRSMVTRALATLFRYGEVFRKRDQDWRQYIYHYK